MKNHRKQAFFFFIYSSNIIQMKTYFNHHDIHTNHIFDFETDCFFHDPIEYKKSKLEKYFLN